MSDFETKKQHFLATFYTAAKNLESAIDLGLRGDELQRSGAHFEQASSDLAPWIQSSADKDICDEVIATQNTIYAKLETLTADAT